MNKLIVLMLASGVGGCAIEDALPDEAAQPTALAAATTIAINFDVRPTAVVYRDGVDAPWQYASRTSALSYRAVVHGPYTVATVCTEAGWITIAQVAQVPADGAAIAQSCDFFTSSLNGFVVQGRMAQPGRVSSAYDTVDTTEANESFTTFMVAGPNDLLARTATDVMIRRNIVVTGDMLLAPVLNAAAQGKPLRYATYAASNAQAGEVLSARAYVELPHAGFLQLHSGGLADIPLAPDSVLAATDAQSVSVRARNGDAWRAQRIPARASNATTAVLPDAIGGPAWTTTADALAFDWASRPANTYLAARYDGTAIDSFDGRTFSFDASAAYLATTGVTHVELLPNFAGFRAQWKADVSIPALRDATFQAVAADGAVSSSWISDVFPLGVAPPRAMARRAPAR